MKTIPIAIRTIRSIALASALAASLVVTTQADDKKPGEQPPKKATKETSGYFPFNGVVKAVDVAKKTITLPGAKGKPDRVFLVTDTTKLQNDGKAIKLEDIQPGQQVGGRAKKGSDGKDEAATINIQPKKTEPKKVQPNNVQPPRQAIPRG